MQLKDTNTRIALDHGHMQKYNLRAHAHTTIHSYSCNQNAKMIKTIALLNNGFSGTFSPTRW